MKIIVSPANYQDAINLIDNNVDILLLSDSKYAVRNQYNCSLDELKKILSYKKTETQIWINVNAFFFESQINDLENYLKQLNQLDIDKVVFNDFAVAQIVYENNLALSLHYNPNTLVTSYGQFDFYLENKINSVSIANELFLNEVLMILKNKPKKFEISLLAHGFVFIMHSRWNLISNFSQYVDDHNDEYIRNKIYYIREESRKFSNIIYEDNYGTHMMSGYELCLIDYLEKLYESGLDYIELDNLMHHENGYSLKLYNIYKNAINAIKEKKYTNELKQILFDECLKISYNKKISAGFIGGINGIKNYEK